MYRRIQTLVQTAVSVSFVILVGTVLLSPLPLWAEEQVIGREVNSFSGVLAKGEPAEHAVFSAVDGTISVELSFVGGNSAILLEVFDSKEECVFRKQVGMTNAFTLDDMKAGNYKLRLTPLQKIQKKLSYSLEVMMPKTVYLSLEEEEVPMAAPEGETAATDKTGLLSAPVPFEAYLMTLFLLLWSWLAVYLYRVLNGRERKNKN